MLSRTDLATIEPPVRLELRRQFDTLLQSPNYQVMTLSGEAGVGKSHLIRQVVRAGDPIAGKFDSGKDSTLAYAAFVQATRKTLNHLLSLSEADFAPWQALFQRELPFASLLPVLPELAYFQSAQARAGQLASPSEILTDTLSLARPFERGFLKLWQCLTGAAHPPRLKVIWLDDVQWMDTASAAFLEFLLQQELPVHWILTGRDTQAVERLLERLQVKHHTRMALQPFSEDETWAFIQAGLGDQAVAPRLAAFLHRLSQGFPLELSWGLREWRLEQNSADDPVANLTGQLTAFASNPYKGWGQLMAQQWLRLSPDVKALLQTGALLGPKFSYRDLELVLSATDFAVRWEAALGSGFLTTGLGEEAQFSHDRLYEWVIASLPCEQKSQGHLLISRQLLQAGSANLELLVEQLNIAAPLLSAAEQQLRLEANLRLIRRMLSQGAVSQAGKLLERLGGELSANSPHLDSYQLLSASFAYLSNQMARAEEILLDLIAHSAQDVLDAHLLLIVIYTQHNRYQESVNYALDLLAELGLQIDGSAAQVQTVYARCQACVRRDSAAQLLAHAQGPSSPLFETRMKIIATVAVAIYNYDPVLYSVCIMYALDQILQGQGTSRTAVIYGAASLLLVNQSGDLESAFKLIHAAEQLARQHGRDDDLTLIHCVMGDFIAPWKISFAATRDYLSSSWEAGLRSGNLQFAGYASVFRGANLFLDAHPLPELAETILPELIHFNQRIQNFSPLDGLRAYLLLIGKLRDGKFESHECQEHAFISELRQRESNADLSRYFTYKAFVLLLFGDAAGASEALEQSQLDIYLPASIARVWHLLLADLIYWRLERDPPPETGHVLPFTLETLARLNPENFEVLYQIWLAEHPGQPDHERIQAYHQALIAARAQSHWHWEGFALEQIARLQHAAGLTLMAQQNLLESIHAFERWGATDKANQLLTELDFYHQKYYRDKKQNLSHELSEILTIYGKFSKILSPTALQHTILQVLKNQSEAEHIELLLRPDDRMAWQCFGLDAETPETLKETHSQLPATLLNYVARTHQSVILPTQREIFPASEIGHLKGLHLLLPLVFQQTLMGMVYLQPSANTPFFGLGAELLLQALGGYLAGALYNAQRSQQLENLIALHTADLQQANLRLSQLLAERQEVLAIAAHDLKHPLGTLRLGLSMLEQMEEKLLPQLRKKALENLIQTVEDMNHNTERLLMIEQLETDILRPKWKHVQLKAIFAPILKSFAWKAREKEQELVFTGFDCEAVVETDSGLLKIVLNNLLENAIKFSPLGARIQACLLVDDRHFILEIHDQGPGFSPEDQVHLFKKFSRLTARPTAGESSHGLGMFIVKRLVEDLGGRIQVGAAPGQGSILSVALPRLHQAGAVEA